MLENDLSVDGVGDRVFPVLLDPIQNHFCLFGAQELVFVGEVRDEEPEKNAEDDGEQTLNEEYPLPTVQPTGGCDQLEAICEDSAETAKDNSRDVECRQTRLNFAPLVPGSDDKDQSRKETGLSAF